MQAAIEAAVNARLQAAVAAELAAHGIPAALAVDIQPRAHVKLGSPPEFSGTSQSGHDPSIWLYKVSNYLTATGVLDDPTRIAIGTYYLSGPALAWWRTLAALPDGAPAKPITWDAFCAALITMFQPTNPVDNARDRLAGLQQRTSVRQYAALMRNAAIEIPGIANDELKDRFIRGLKKEVRQEVRMRAPATFEEAVQVAERFDSLRYNSSSERQQPSRFLYERRGFNDGGGPMELGALEEPQPRWNGRQNEPRWKNGGGDASGKLTPELRQKLIKEGRCFYCRETGHRALACPKRKQQNK